MSKASHFIAGDELIVADNICMTLESRGYRVAGIAQTGEDVINLIPGFAPDLVLMYIRLAGTMDGIETAGWVRIQTGIPEPGISTQPAASDQHPDGRQSV